MQFRPLRDRMPVRRGDAEGRTAGRSGGRTRVGANPP